MKYNLLFIIILFFLVNNLEFKFFLFSVDKNIAKSQTYFNNKSNINVDTIYLDDSLNIVKKSGYGIFRVLLTDQENHFFSVEDYYYLGSYKFLRFKLSKTFDLKNKLTDFEVIFYGYDETCSPSSRKNIYSFIKYSRKNNEIISFFSYGLKDFDNDFILNSKPFEIADTIKILIPGYKFPNYDDKFPNFSKFCKYGFVMESSGFTNSANFNFVKKDFIKYNGKFLKLIEFKIDMDELGDNLKYVYNLYLNDTIIKNSEIFNNIKNLPPKYFESEIFLIGTDFKEKKSYIFDPFVIKKTNPEFFTNDFYLRFFISNQTGESAYEWKTKHEKKQLEQELKLKK